ncbi:MAG: phage holin family protein [bacterium]|nr:phage holin family protein [bacterium]
MNHTKPNQLLEVKDFLNSFFGLKTPIINISAGFSAYWISNYHKIFIDNDKVFLAITAVILLDFIFGVTANINDFRTRKALKLVWYLTGYWAIAATTITVELAFKSAFWLTDTIMLTIITFQFISILKNACKCGILTNAQFKAILDKIDKHKDYTTDETSPSPNL